MEGLVKVRLLVGADGRVGLVEALGARPGGCFEQTVRRHPDRWRFVPARLGGRAVAAGVATTARFRLD